MKYINKYFEKCSNAIWNSRWFSWLIPVLVLAAWAIWGVSPDAGKGLLPTPVQVWNGFVRLLLNGTLYENIKISSIRAFKGLAWGGLIGFVLGVINGISEKADKLLNVPIQMIRNVPYLAMMPLILVWFGIGETTKTILIAIGVFFPIYLNTYHGIRFIDRNFLEMAKVYGLSNTDLYLNIIFPGALPSILVGLKQSLGRMWVILIVAEQIAAKSGIGFMVTNAREFMLMDVIVLGLILYALLGSLSDIATTLLERHLLKWRYSTERMK
nr:ABC transporter permease subunit [Sedimentibacter sp.]